MERAGTLPSTNYQLPRDKNTLFADGRGEGVIGPRGEFIIDSCKTQRKILPFTREESASLSRA